MRNKALHQPLEGRIARQLRLFWWYHSYHVLAFSMAIFSVAGLWLGIIPKELRFIVLGSNMFFAIIFTVYAVYVKKMWIWEKLGFQTANIKKAFPEYMTFLGLAVALLVGVKYATGGFFLQTERPWIDLVIIPIGVSIPQEFLYRSFIIMLLLTAFRTRSGLDSKNTQRSKIAAIIWGTVYFSFLHIFYENTHMVLFLSGLLGLGLNILWIRNPNFFLAVLVHIPLNMLAIGLGIFPKI